jgi:uncharacterized lipoprotein YddW (UPF0748 family)
MRIALVIAIALITLALAYADDGARPARPKVRLGSPVTHSDWMLRDPAPAWGPQGVHQILDRAKQCGWTRVYWRCFDGGLACYTSRVAEPYYRYEDDNYHRAHGSTWVLDRLKPVDFRHFDALKEAVSYGHKIGLEVHAWLSLNEDDHGWGLQSRFNREHPQTRWVRRDGRPYRSQQSFAFPEVRAYKLAIVAEVLSYGVDGVFFDWIRTGDVRDNPQTEPNGVANYGYEAPNIAAFSAKYGLDPHEVPNDDPRWVHVRAEPQTAFMREAHALIKQTDPRLAVTAMVQHPWSYRGGPKDTPYADNLQGLLCDVRTWAREGLIDGIVAAGYYREGGNAERAFRALQKETGGKAPVWGFGWITTPEQFAADTTLAEKLGAPELLLWESDYIALPPANQPLADAMARFAGP